MKQRKRYLLLLTAPLIIVGFGCRGASEDALAAIRQTQSRNNISQLCKGALAMKSFSDMWPENLEELGKSVGGPADLAELLVNPVTGDNPGYEYVKPEENSPLSQLIIVYQLRNGKRDLTLPVGYGDGSVRPIGPPSKTK